MNTVATSSNKVYTYMSCNFQIYDRVVATLYHYEIVLSDKAYFNCKDNFPNSYLNHELQSMDIRVRAPDFTLYISYQTAFFKKCIVKSVLNGF